MTSSSYLTTRQRQISKSKWQPLHTLGKQHQRNRLCVNLSTLSLIFILLFSYIYIHIYIYIYIYWIDTYIYIYIYI